MFWKIFGPSPFEVEREAWRAVADDPPGTPNHDAEAWNAWLNAAEEASPAGLVKSGWGDLTM